MKTGLSLVCGIILATLLGLGACTATEPAPPGFITENRPAPKGAQIKEGDVPRTDYGRPYQYNLLGRKLPEFKVTSPTGEELTQNDLSGNWLILDVWGVWCPDCQADGPYVQKLADEISKRESLDFMSMHSPPSAERADQAFGKYGSVDAYFEAKGYDYPYVIDADASAKSALDLPWVPSYLLVDPEGVIRGYRSDLSVGGDNVVADFIADAERVMTGG